AVAVTTVSPANLHLIRPCRDRQLRQRLKDHAQATCLAAAIAEQPCHVTAVLIPELRRRVEPQQSIHSFPHTAHPQIGLAPGNKLETAWLTSFERKVTIRQGKGSIRERKEPAMKKTPLGPVRK